MVYGSVCSGIEAATVAWHKLGWKPAWFSEIDAFPCKVLAHHYPNVPNLGDMTKLSENEIYNNTVINLLVGGTPCQSFSIAGLRGGLDSTNGNLALEFCRILLRKQPRWFVWENVPGVFSSFSGEETEGGEITETSDFASILAGFQECGYSCAYRILDSQYFGVPQRRRRVFVVGYLGDNWRPSAAVLFERESLRRDFTPSRKEGEKVAGNTEKGFDKRGKWPAEIVSTLDCTFGTKQGLDDQHINGGAIWFVPVKCFDYTRPGKLILNENLSVTVTKGGTKPGNSIGVIYGIPGNWIGRNPENGGNATEPMVDISPCQTKTDRHAVVYDQHFVLPDSQGDAVQKLAQDQVPTLTCMHEAPILFQAPTPYIIRRLTPLECERLQGFPDNYTNIPKSTASGQYAACGNSMTTNVMKWIGERIQKVDDILNKLNK